MEYCKDPVQLPKAVLWDLNEKKRIDLPFNGENIVPTSIFSMQYDCIPTFDFREFAGVYNAKENRYTELNISNQLVQKSNRYGGWMQMNSQNLFYIDENFNLVKSNLQTLENTTTEFCFAPAENIWLLAANENNRVLYYTNSPDAGTIKLYITT